jgi:hypothetical protein
MRSRALTVGLVLVGLMMSLPGNARADQCTSSQDAAVQCFAKNALSTSLLVVPPGMSTATYRSFVVAVSHTLQDPTTTVFLLGMAGAVADALPPSNADGSANQAAQDAAMNAIVDAGLKDGMFVLPAETTSDNLKLMARYIAGAMGQNSGVTVSPGTVFRILNSYIVAATSSTGTVDWLQATTNISKMVDGLISAGLLKLPAGISAGNVKQFAVDVASAIYQYTQATQKSTL